MSKRIALNGAKNKVENSIYTPQTNFLTLKESYTVSASRTEGEKHVIDIKADEFVEFIFDDDTAWFGNTQTIQELFPEIDINKRSANEETELPFILTTDNESRSIKSIALKVFNVFAKNVVKEGVQELAEYLEKKLLDNQSGLYSVDNSFELSTYSAQASDNPFLLFLHGTGSSTLGSFAELNGSDLWNEIKKMYGSNILAFQHETFTKSPLQNALELFEALPEKANLHLITHSRGGLVGEIVARFCADENGFSEMGIALLSRNERSQDVANIKAIKNIIVKKQIKLEKFIRVACPARGTSLLSNRLDFYFNVTLNLVSFATGSKINPIVEGFKALISAILESKNDVNVLPGLEAMSPSSPFLKALNAPDVVCGNIAVISGNANFSLSLKALVVIVSKLVFKGENDFVVNTTSMYQGAKREKALMYFFDEGSDVNHFSYFKNSKTQQAILSVLNAKDGSLPAFKEYKQLSLDGDQRGVFGLDGGAVYYDEVTGNKPIVIILPGIMGSNLSKNGSGVWVNYLKMLFGGLADLQMGVDGIKAKSLIKTSYKKICVNLSEEYDVVTFPYDWRLSVTDSAKYLNDKVKFLLDYNQPIKIIAHSMGGVLAREFIINHSATWNNLNKSTGFKLVFLGTPWMGSYRIPNVFAGRDGIIRQLDKLDHAHSKEELIKLFVKFPGILNLLPIRPSDHDFGEEKTWTELQKASKLNWTIPTKALINDFAKWRKNILDNIDKIDYSNMCYVAGKDPQTQKTYKIVNGELQFEPTVKGDQSVTWESGIPIKLKTANAVYFSNITHGDLANNEILFPAIRQLLISGSTDLLSKMEPILHETVSRSIVQTEEEEVFETDEVTAIHKILGIPLESKKEKSNVPILKVSVSNGDLMFSAYPIIVGHFKGDGIVSAERVADNYLKGELSIKHVLGNYPGDIGTHLFASSNHQEFNGACIVGLGQVDKLSSQGLTTTIEKAMIDYLLQPNYVINDTRKNKAIKGISVLLIGADYGGLSADTSIRSIIQGIQIANEKVNAIKQNQVSLIEHVEFVELFEDRSLQCFYSLKKIMNSSSDEIQIAFKSTKIKNLLGSRKRILMENKADWWQRLTVLAENNPTDNSIKQLNFFTATNGAREEKKELQSSITLIEDLLENISTKEQWTPEVAKTIFELLIPNEFKENIRRQTDILWVLDKYTASYPWELFQTDIEKSKPLCINAGMIRQLATAEYRTNTTPVNNKNVLIIGDPLTHGYCNQLPGAEKEAKEVAKLFGQFDYEIESQIKKNSGDITTALFKQEYKIIHISGHGNFDKAHPEKSGMIIGKNVFLTPREFNQLSYTPELVFVNCCYLGKVDSEQENLYSGRYKFAANIGTQLIQNGVKVVIAAGWAVDDAAALEFATVFYDCMFEGYEFGKAVTHARKIIYDKYPYTNTWGAFQCYGDPFYKLKITNKKTVRERNYIIPQEAEHEIDNLLSKAQISYFESSSLHDELDAILKAIFEFKVATPDLLEKVAIAYMEVNDYKKAIELFKQVLTSEKASYTVSSLEKYNNILAKQLLSDYQENKNSTADFVTEINTVISSLSKLLEIAETSERHSLIGSAYKRKAAICDKAKEKIEALNHAAFHYFKAHERDNNNAIYSLVNWIEIEFFLNELAIHKWGAKVIIKINGKQEEYKLSSLASLKTKLEKCIESIDNKVQFESHDYWDLVARANAALCLWLLKGAPKDAAQTNILNEYRKTWENVGSKNKKMSEIEHFNLLIDFCGLFKTDHILKSVTKLKNDLLKEIK